MLLHHYGDSGHIFYYYLVKTKLNSGQDGAGHVRVQRGDRASECGPEEWVSEQFGVFMGKAHARSAGLEGGGEDRYDYCVIPFGYMWDSKSQVTQSDRLFNVVFDYFFYSDRNQSYIEPHRLPYSLSRGDRQVSGWGAGVSAEGGDDECEGGEEGWQGECTVEGGNIGWELTNWLVYLNCCSVRISSGSEMSFHFYQESLLPNYRMTVCSKDDMKLLKHHSPVVLDIVCFHKIARFPAE